MAELPLAGFQRVTTIWALMGVVVLATALWLGEGYGRRTYSADGLQLEAFVGFSSFLDQVLRLRIQTGTLCSVCVSPLCRSRRQR